MGIRTNTPSRTPFQRSAMPPMRNDGPCLAITYGASLADHWRCNLYIMTHRWQSVLINFLPPLLLSAQAILLIRTDPLAALTVTTLMFTGWSLFLLFVLFLTLLILYPFTRHCITILWPDGLRDETALKTISVSWSHITGVREHHGDVYVWRGAVAGTYIPRTAFRNRTAAQEFARTAEALWKGQSVQWPAAAMPDSWPEDATVWPPPPRVPS